MICTPHQNCTGDLTKKMRQAGQVARKGDRRGVYTVLVGTPEGRDHFEDPGIKERTVLKWIFRKWEDGGGRDSIDLVQKRRTLLHAVSKQVSMSIHVTQPTTR